MSNVPLRFVERPGGLTIAADDRDVATYVWKRDAPQLESPRPYFHPLTTLGGTVVSDHRPPDHDWHWGLSIAIANVAIGEEAPDINWWGGVTYTRERGYVQLDNNGDQRHEGHTLSRDGVTERLTWAAASGRKVMTEERVIRARRVETAALAPLWRLDVSSRWSNATEEVLRFGSPTTAGRANAGYGGLFLRAAPMFQNATIISPEGHSDPMGERAAWLGLAHESATVVIAASAANPVSPSLWFARTETPMLCAAPFFHEEWRLAAGASALWKWSVLVSDGCLDASQAHMALAASGS